MNQITARTLRSIEWKPVYNYEGRVSFTTYASDALPGLTITKERRGHKRVKTNTIYKYNDQRTDSPTQIVRIYNEQARKTKSDGGRPAAGRPKSAGRPSGDAGI